MAQDTELFLGAKQKTALANLKIALSTRDAAVLITGPAGTGKSAIGSHALRTMSTRLAVGWIGHAPLTGHELLEQLLTEFGFSPYKSSRVERLQIWRQFLNEMSLTDTRIGVLVEQAEDVDVEVLQALQSLTAADPSGCPGANLVLTGGPDLQSLLQVQALSSLRQRIRLVQQLSPLSPEELRAFVEYKIGAAGGDSSALFAPGALQMLHRYSRGCIRVVKNLCETSLTVAATRGERQLSPKLIMQVAVNLLGLEPAPAERASAPAEQAPAGPSEQAPTASEQASAPSEQAPAPSEQASAPVGQTPAPAQQPPPLPMTAAQAPRSSAASPPTFMSGDVGMSEQGEDLPTLTDSVEIPEDTPSAIGAPDPVTAAAADPGTAGGDDSELQESDETDDLVLEEESIDPNEDALEAFANAKALEDISNSMAETLFGDSELSALAATLAVSSAEQNEASSRDGERESSPEAAELDEMDFTPASAGTS